MVDYENILAGIVMIVNGIFGIITNSTIFFLFVKEPSQRTSFNLICVFRAVTNIYILFTTFIIDFAPACFLGYSPFNIIADSCLIGIANSVYLIIQYQSVFVAANRFVAIHFPTRYGHWFQVKTTLIILLAMYIFRIIAITDQLIEKLPTGCHAFFNLETLSWTATGNASCFDSDSSFFSVSTFLIISIIINIITFIGIANHFMKTTGDRNQLKKSSLLFVQTLVQDSLVFIDFSFSFRLFALSDNRLWTFFCGTIIWQCVHSLDGIIMLMFNDRIKILRRKLESTANPVTKLAKSSLPDVQ